MVRKRDVVLLGVLADIFSDGLGKSAPRSACRGLILSIIQDLPSSLIDQDTLSKVSLQQDSFGIALTIFRPIDG